MFPTKHIWEERKIIMATEQLPAELERRINELENPANQGDGFTSADWIWLALLGVIGPILLLIWGWT
jgi:hypothetical protein